MIEESYSKIVFVSVKPKLVYVVITEQIEKWWTTSSNIVREVGSS